MKFIIDAQLSPHLAKWLTQTFELEAYSVSYLNMISASDIEIFDYAKKENAIVITKDEDFVQLLYRLGSPPKIIWLTFGNTTNERVKNILNKNIQQIIQQLEHADLVEISD